MSEFKRPVPQFKIYTDFFTKNDSNTPYDPICMQYVAPESGTYEYLDVDGKTIKKFHHEGEVITVRVNKDDKNRDD